MTPTFMDTLQASDPDFFKLVKPVVDAATGAGGLDQKMKTLIILFLDAIRGQGDAVKAVAARARSQGATEAEIADVVRLAFLTSGYSALVAGTAAFQK